MPSPTPHQLEALKPNAQNYVSIFAVPHTYGKLNNSVLLIKRKHEPNLGLWNLPGGKIGDKHGVITPQDITDKRATPAEAVVTKLKLETGLDASFPQFSGVMIGSDGDWQVMFYRCIVTDTYARLGDIGESQLSRETRDKALLAAGHTRPTEEWKWVPINNLTLSRPEFKLPPDLHIILPLMSFGEVGWRLEQYPRLHKAPPSFRLFVDE